jgi:hypothetical protein
MAQAQPRSHGAQTADDRTPDAHLAAITALVQAAQDEVDRIATRYERVRQLAEALGGALTKRDPAAAAAILADFPDLVATDTPPT